MQMFLSTLFCCSAAMSVISLFYMAAIPLLSKKYSSKWLYYIWLLVVIGWVFPFRPYLDIYTVPIHIPKIQFTQAKYTVLNQQLDVAANGTGGISSIPLGVIIACIWALGAAAVIGYYVWRHHLFMKMVNRWSEDITNQEILHILDGLKSEMNIRKQVGLKICPNISSPMMIGFIRSNILLPSVDIDPEELIFILRHELIHRKRNDLWYKSMVLLSIAIHWFNPIIYFVARAVEVQCEISCDEILVKETSFQQRRQYGETIIGAIRKGVNIHTALSTDFYSPGRIIKTRIIYIMDTTKKRAGFVVLCLAFIAVVGSGIAYASDLTYNFSKNIQIINVDVNELKAGNVIYFEGPYDIKAGDIVRYNITSDNNKNLYVDVIRNNTITYGKSILSQNFKGYYLGFPTCQVTIGSGMAGKYCLLVKFKNLEGASDIKGTIEIIRDKNNN